MSLSAFTKTFIAFNSIEEASFRDKRSKAKMIEDKQDDDDVIKAASHQQTTSALGSRCIPAPLSQSLE